jgi:hypothetical protein
MAVQLLFQSTYNWPWDVERAADGTIRVSRGVPYRFWNAVAWLCFALLPILCRVDYLRRHPVQAPPDPLATPAFS